MTRRSIIMGILCATFLCGVTYFNDMVMKGTFLIGNYLPISVFGGLIVAVLLVNPLLSKIRARAALSGAELAVIMSITFFACFVPGRGLMHHFTAFLMIPHHYERTVPQWRGEPVALDAGQISDWKGLVATLTEAGKRPENDPARHVWDRLPAELRRHLEAGEVSTQRSEDRMMLIEGLNAAIRDPAFHAGLPVPQHAPASVRILAGRRSSTLTAREHALFSRGLLELAMPGILHERRPGVLENVPTRMLADISRDPARTLDGFVTGLAQGDAPISWREIPWHAWWRALLFWIPLILTMSAAVTGLALVLHRQWSSHEHLPYPITEFATALLPEEGRTISAIFKNRLFWIGAGAVLLIHLSNYLALWWPAFIIPVQTRFDLTPLMGIFTVFQADGGGALFDPTLYFTAIGFAYFLASDVAVSLGVAPYLYAFAFGLAARYGLSLGSPSNSLAPTVYSFLCLGGCVGLFATVMYGGRRYYKAAFARSLALRSQDPVEGHAVWGARLFLAASIGFVVQLVAVGVDWQIAALYTLGAIMIFTAISRLVAEAGVFYLMAYGYPCAMLWGFMGETALGRGQMLVLGMVSTVFMFSSTREAMMPFAVSALQLSDRMKQRLGRIAGWGLLAMVAGLLVAVSTTLYWQYRYGAFQVSDNVITRSVVAVTFHNNVAVTRTLEAQGSLGLSESLGGWQRFAHMAPEPKLVTAFLCTFCLVLLFRFLRHRFAWWPLHPLIFVVLGTLQTRSLAFSFLLGWGLKKLVTKYGGAALYHRLKPLMIGLVAGEVMAGLIPIIVGAIYYLVTGTPPKPFRILPF